MPMAAPSRLCEGSAAPVGLETGGTGGSLLELAAASVAELGPGLLGEGDGCDLAQLDRSADDGDQTTDQRGRLPGAAPASTNSVVSRSVAMRSQALVGRREAG